MLTKHDTETHWHIVADPTWNLFTEALSKILYNPANKYAEYKNNITQYRMIRLTNAKDYGFTQSQIPPSAFLNPNKIPKS